MAVMTLWVAVTVFWARLAPTSMTGITRSRASGPDSALASPSAVTSRRTTRGQRCAHLLGSFHGHTGAMLLHDLGTAIQAHQALIQLVPILCTAHQAGAGSANQEPPCGVHVIPTAYHCSLAGVPGRCPHARPLLRSPAGAWCRRCHASTTWASVLPAAVPQIRGGKAFPPFLGQEGVKQRMIFGTIARQTIQLKGSQGQREGPASQFFMVIQDVTLRAVSWQWSEWHSRASPFPHRFHESSFAWPHDWADRSGAYSSQ